jgi:hypothetical protein
LGVNYLTLGGNAIKLRGGSNQPGTGKKAPVRPPARFDGLSLFIDKAPPDGQPDKKSWNPPF